MKTIMFGFSITNSSLTHYFLSVCNRLAETHRVIVVTDKTETHPFRQSEKLIILRWPSARPVHLRDFIFLMRLVLRYRPRTMVSMFGAMNLFVLVGFLARVRNRIAWNHSIYAKTSDRAKLDRRKIRIYRMATAVFANSRATAQDTSAHFKVPDAKLRVFYNAVADAGRLNRNPAPSDFLFIGRLQPIKGIDTLLAAMPEVVRRRPDAKLKIVGGQIGGNAIARYRQMARDLGVADHVLFLGSKTPQQVTDILCEVSFTVVPSVLEAFGMVIIESFSAGVPVIGSRTTGIAEIVRDGRDGLLFETGNAVALAACVVEMLDDAALRLRCAQSAREHFLESFELEKVTAAVAEHLASL